MTYAATRPSRPFSTVAGKRRQTAPTHGSMTRSDASISNLARQGCCHSIEAWQDETLVGGLYGIALHGAFFGESMFSRAPNASKIALVHLVARLRRGGFTLLDCQFINEHLRQFGAVEIERGTFQRLLADALRRPARFYCEPDSGELVDALLQSTTHTS